MNPRFAQSAQISKQEALDARTREVQGDGGPFLKVPGLVTLSAIAVMSTIGRVPLALDETRLVMINHDERQPREAVHEPMFDLQNAGTTQAVLARSILSNDGNFQKDASFYVTGDWHDEPSHDEPSHDEPEETDKSEASTTGAAVAATPPATDGKNAADDKTDVEEPVEFESLPDELKEKLKGFDSLEAALNATNEQFNAVGIKGLEIANVRRALKKAAANV